MQSFTSATQETIKAIEPVITLERNLRQSFRATGESLEKIKQQRKHLAQSNIAKSISMHDFRGNHAADMKRSATFHHQSNHSSQVSSGPHYIDSIRRPVDDAIYHEEQEQLFINQDVTLEWKCDQELNSFQRYTFRHLINREACETANMFKLMICNDAQKNLNTAALFASITVVEHGPANSRIYKELFSKKVWISAKQSVTYMLTINTASSIYIQLQSFALFMKTPITIRLFESHCESASKQIRFVVDENRVIDSAVDEEVTVKKSPESTEVPKRVTIANEKLPERFSTTQQQQQRKQSIRRSTSDANISSLASSAFLTVAAPTLSTSTPNMCIETERAKIQQILSDQQSSSAVEFTDTDECTFDDDDDELFFDPSSVTTPPSSTSSKPSRRKSTKIIENYIPQQFCEQQEENQEQSESARLL